MTIEWFPGHMATARKEAAETMRKTDVVIEVLDARVPYSSCSPLVEMLRRENQRPALKILNKSDVADPVRTKAWLAHYQAQPGVKAIAVCSRRAGDVAAIPKVCLELVPTRGTMIKPLRMMIMGIPNVGKSTLMNSLLRRHVANVGNEPAITKNQMRHEVGPGVWLVDTPGLMWPGVPQDVAFKLAASHSIGRNAYEEESVALDLASYLLTDYPELLSARYGRLEELPAEPPNTRKTDAPAHALLEHIANARNLVAKGGSADTGRAAQQLLNDFRMGTLGAITLETVEQAAARRRRTPWVKPKAKK